MIWMLIVLFGGISVLFAQQSFWAYNESYRIENKIFDTLNSDFDSNEASYLGDKCICLINYSNYCAIGCAVSIILVFALVCSLF